MYSPQIIFEEIKILTNYFRKSKAYFRYIPPTSINNLVLDPYNLTGGLTLTLTFSEPITESYMIEHNSIGHYLNQNFLVRLYALLESHNVIGDNIPINKNLPGHIELDILRRLRNRFAHSSGKFNKYEKDDEKLQQTLVEHFQIEVPKFYEDFPINQDKVIYPIIAKMKEYIYAKSSTLN